MRRIETEEQHWALVNKMAKYKDNFEPYEVTFSFDKKRTLPQNRYYWGVIVDMQVAYFKTNLVQFLEFIMRVVKFNVTAELVHILNKIFFNRGRSTADLERTDFVEYTTKIREDMLHYCEVDIPLPQDEALAEWYNEQLNKE